MVYVGALTALLDIDVEVLKSAVADQLKGKEKLVAANMEAVALGREYAAEHFDCPLPIRVRHAQGAKGKILVSGNDAAGLGAVYAGATVCAWYPITPSTSLAEAFERYAKRLRVTKDGRQLYGIVQAEDELAAIGVAIGGGWNGARAFTATSGPGISLMSEFLGLAYFAEVPVVLFNIQRGGPSTGMPTRTQQSDILSCAYASHGDTKHVLLFPANPTECFSLGAQAFDLAERLQTPVIVMSDLDIGMNDWVTRAVRLGRRARARPRQGAERRDELENFKELKGTDWGRYQDIDGDAIPYRTLPGTHPTKGAFFTRGTSHDENARYTEDGRIHARVLDRIRRKFDTAADAGAEARDHDPRQERQDRPHLFRRDHAGRARGARRARARRREGQCAAASRPFPFTRDVAAFCAMHERVFVVEQNRDAQMRSLLMTEANVPGDQADPGPQLRRHAADGRLRARRGAEARCSPRQGRGRIRTNNELHRQTLRPPSGPAEEHARPDAARLRRHHVDAVRGLRPRLDHGGADRSLLRDGPARAPHRQGVRASAARRRRRPISSPAATASTRCTGACRRSPPAPPSPTAISSTSASPATATRPRSGSASSATPCAGGVNMTYIVMNNGCYGLTKGQFSATNDKTSPSKKGEANPFDAIDLCQMAIQLGAGFVARSFSGDKTQLIPLIKAAISYNGFAFLDVISPCVTFNNHPTSTKSYDYVRAHNMAVGEQARLRRAEGGDHRRLRRGHLGRASRCTTARA